MLKLLIQKAWIIYDNLLLENIEALAAGETGSGGACVGRGSVVCPLTKEGVEHVHIYYSMPH